MTDNHFNKQTPPRANDHIHATLRDVADLADVSIKTVSRVVNQQGEISDTTRKRVQEAIEYLGYRPNVLARNLIHRRTDTLAVVAWGIDYFGPSRTVLGIEKQANELGYSLFLHLVDQPDFDYPERVLDSLIARRVDGIIWAVPEVGTNRRWIKADNLSQLPPIVFLTMGPFPGIPVITIDNRDGARQAVNHLIAQGKRKIGIINGPLLWWEAKERFAGWQEALRGAGFDPSDSLVANSDDWSAINGEEGMRRLWEQEPEIDAIFASNDQIALGALGIAHRLGKKIPEDLAVVGFDNIPEAGFFWPPLTTVYQQLVDVGRVAVKNLQEMIMIRRSHGEQKDPSFILFKPELVIRASSSSG